MKIFKLIATVLVLGIGLAVGVPHCNAQLSSIPSNIEPDRVRPLAKVELPEVRTSPDFVDYFLEPAKNDVQPMQNYPLVHIRIPKKPHFEPHVTSGPVRTYGQTLNMVWPDLSGLGEPGGAACLKHFRDGIGGFCPNQVTLYIDYMWQQKPSLEQGLLANLDRDIQMQPIKPIEQKSAIEGLEIIGINNFKDVYYVSRNTAGARELVFNCRAFDPSPACEARFTSDKSPNIVIKILFVHSLLPQWRQVVDAVQTKVSGYIVQTYSLPSKE